MDLPGTDSLTTSNVETTGRYLDESVGVVFLLRTVPPLTRSESIFVAFHWARLPTAFFVQNRWTDERAEEAEGGRQHNLIVLKQLAARIRIPMDGDPHIHVVNAYQALRGRLTGNAMDLEASGLGRFEADLEARAREWPIVLRKGIVGAVRGDLQAALEAIERRSGELNADRATNEAQLKTEEERFKQYIDELETKFAETRESIESFQSDRRRDIEDWRRDAASAMRNEMRTKLRQGIVDGPRLSQALLDEESEQTDQIFQKVQEELLSFQDRLQERFQDIREWKPGKTGFRVDVNRPETTKWESIAEPLLSAAVAVVGGWASVKAGAWLGAGLGSAGGPLGAAIGLAVGGILGGLFGAWAGRKVRDQVILERAKAAEREVFRAIDRFVNGIRSDLLHQLEQFQEPLLKGLGDWIEAQRSSFEVGQKKTLEGLGATKREREVCLGKLATDAAQLRKWLAALEEEAT